MKYFVAPCLAGLFFLGACGHRQPSSDQPKQDSLPATDSIKNSFFPVAEYLETEILHVDSVPLALKKFTISNGKTDSAFIQVPEFNQLALQFLPAELHNGTFEKKYTENSFVDKSTESVIFSYTTEDTTLSLRRVDVQTVGDKGMQHVKSIYVEKRRSAGDSLILQKMYWRGGRAFQVVSLTTVKGRAPVEQQVRVVWGDE